MLGPAVAGMASVVQPVLQPVLQTVLPVLQKAHHFVKPALSETFINVFIPLSAVLGLIFAIWCARWLLCNAVPQPHSYPCLMTALSIPKRMRQTKPSADVVAAHGALCHLITRAALRAAVASEQSVEFGCDPRLAALPRLILCHGNPQAVGARVSHQGDAVQCAGAG